MKKLLNAGPSEAGWHRLQSVLQCPRKYALGLQTPWQGSEATMKGSLMHIGLAHHYMLQKEPEGDYYQPTEAVGQLALIEYGVSQDERWLEYGEMINQTLVEYIEHWRGEQWKVLHVEEQMKVYIYDEERQKKYLYTQRPDLIVQDKWGKVWIVDHKTTFRIGPKTIQRYSLSGQFLGYKMLGKAFFKEQFAGLVLNMIQHPSGRKGPEFARPNLAPAPNAERRHKQTLIYAERLIQDHSHLLDPMDWPGAHHETACWTPYGACPYHNQCQWGTNS